MVRKKTRLARVTNPRPDRQKTEKELASDDLNHSYSVDWSPLLPLVTYAYVLSCTGGRR